MTTRKTAGRPTSYDPDIPGKCVEMLEARGMEITFAGVRDLMTAEFGVSPGRPESLERQIQSYLDQRDADRDAARIVKLPPSVTQQIDQHADAIKTELLRRAGLQHETIETEVRKQMDAAQADLKSHRAIIVKLEAHLDELIGERDVAQAESETLKKENTKLQNTLARAKSENARLKERLDERSELLEAFRAMLPAGPVEGPKRVAPSDSRTG